MELSELNEYINGKRHPGYEKACYLYHALRRPAEGEYPQEAIEIRRDKESETIKDFRKKIWVEVSKETISQILTCLSKIRRSSDWSVEFPKEQPSFIPEDETLRNYTEKYFPFYTTFESWTFSVLLKNYLIDPNAVVLVAPLNPEVQANEYLKPYPIIYNSHQVLDYKENEYAVFEVKKKIYKNGMDTGMEQKKYIVVDTQFITTYKQTQNGFIQDEVYAHGLGVLPCFKMRGRFFKNYDGYTINESPIQTVAPRLKEFDREYSDLQAEVFQHTHSEKWQWATQLCLYCSKNGISTGRLVEKKTKKEVTCPQCHGMGQVSASPYQNIVIRPSKKNIGEQDAPIPPAGYIEKTTDIVKIQDERCDKHAYKALCSINMQFLMQVPQNQSGYAKDVDREELNNFAYGVAEDIIWMMDRLYYLFAKYRYRAKADGQVLNDDEIQELLPTVAVPEKFDLLSSNYLIDERQKATTAKVNPLILAFMDFEYASKHFYNEPEMRDLLKLCIKLDTMPGLTPDEKLAQWQNDGQAQIDYVISCNIYEFVQRALEEKKDFANMELKEQKKIIRGYGEEKLTEIEVQSEPITEPSLNGNNQ